MLKKKGALFNNRYRIIVTTDIGGSDPDDFQSMVHYLLYSDLFDTEGLISSAWGDGRKEDILTVIDEYEKDYPKLITYSDKYPTPQYLRSITKQGETNIAPLCGYRRSTEASKLIIECAKKDDPRFLYILGWGLLEDIAQALHDDPSIVNKIRVYFISGPNKKWGPSAYEYILNNFPQLWFIENNSTYRGWFNGGIMDGNYSNTQWVKNNAKGHGALGDFFANKLGGCIKMGDTPSVAYFLYGLVDNPIEDSWGGRFVQVYNRPHSKSKEYEKHISVFEVFENVLFEFKGPKINVSRDKVVFYMVVQNQKFNGYYSGNGIYRCYFMPKSIGDWKYLLESEIEELNGIKGEFKSIRESEENRKNKGQKLKNWYSDILDPELKEGEHCGAKTINQYRKIYLDDFEERFDRCIKKK